MLTRNCKVRAVFTMKCLVNKAPSFNPGLGSIRVVYPGHLVLLRAKCIVLIFSLSM